MPGTIRVSVLEFMDLPELLPPPISVKVSMGKRLYESSDKGDFSFPLTTLRDDVILIIQDAGGSEISRAGVQAKSIVEKGYWDDIFPLEGGGRVHLQLQFALTEHDRSRIRMMRETAMRRKQVERQDRNLKSSGSNLASSLYMNPELSDSQKCLLQVGDLNAKEAAHQSSSTSAENIHHDEKPVTEKTDDVRLDLIQRFSVENDADRNKDSPSTIPLLQEVDVNKPKVNKTQLVEWMKTQSPHLSKPSPTIRSEENLFRSQGSESSNSLANDEVKAESSEERSHRKTPNKVKNVINAFESSLTQDPIPRIKPSLRSTQHSVVDNQTFPKVNPLKKVTTIDPHFAEESSHDIHEKEQKLKFIGAPDTTKPSLRSTQHGLVDNQTYSKVNQLKKATTIDSPLADELTHDIHQKEQKQTFIDASDVAKLSVDSRESLKFKEKKNLVEGENMSEKYTVHKEHDDIDANNDESYQKLVPEAPDSVRGESVSHVKDEQFPSKRSGGWIFPDERRRLCVTTGGNQMLDMVGGRTSYTFSRNGETKISTEENRSTSETNANEGKHDDDHQKIIKPPESSDDVKPCEGALGNAFKIAIMVGFGTLVLLTRQRKKKK